MLRVLLDRDGMPAQFMLLGSASPELLRQTTESLAGRVEVIEVSGFTIEEGVLRLTDAAGLGVELVEAR